MCSRCGKNKKAHGTICVDCHREDVRERYRANKNKYNMERAISRFNAKIKYINDLGGQCVICGYRLTDTNAAAFDFHHTDPTKKDVQISRSNYIEVQNEIKKCQLLCANCHRILHSTLYKSVAQQRSA
jgi:predicted HNH restriction endonuclease